ncbi:unnamed protein product, partial [Musa acuminata subsp. burmannicoides]
FPSKSLPLHCGRIFRSNLLSKSQIGLGWICCELRVKRKNDGWLYGSIDRQWIESKGDLNFTSGSLQLEDLACLVGVNITMSSCYIY